MIVVATSLVVIGSLAGCGGGDDESTASFDASVEPVAASADMPGGEVLAEGAPPTAGVETAAVPGGEQAADVDFGSIGRDVIVEMHVSMHSDDLARTVASISARAAGLGGGIASSDIDYGTQATPDPDSQDPAALVGGYAVLVVKIPPASVNTLLDGLADSGTVIAVNQSATDVTDQLVDLDVRIANARASVDNVRGFMEQTTNLTELVSLESELTRRQTELEQLEAQLRGLSDRVSLSTLTIEVRPTPVAAAVSAAKPDDGIADAFRTGWNAFVGTIFAIAFIVAILAPFLAVALVVLGVALVVTRRRKNHPAGRQAPAPEPDADVTSIAGHATITESESVSSGS